MARYGRDFDRDRWGGAGGYGGSSGGRGRGAFRGGEYGKRPDAPPFAEENWANRGVSGFGAGGGGYDVDFEPGSRGGRGFSGGGYGGYGYGGGGGGAFGRGYGADTGFAGGGYGGTESDWGGRGDYGYGEGGFGGGTGRASRFGGGYGGGQQSWGGGRQSGDDLRLRAADVMTDNPECVTPDTTLAEAAGKMRDLDVGIIPVVDSESNRRLRGVLTDRDITIRAVADGRDARSTKVADVMTTEVETCNKNDSIRDVLSVMEREQVRRVPITDREGRLVGIIAQADVATQIDSHQGEHRVAETVERISEPAGRGRGGMRSSQGRGGREGGGMSARGWGSSGAQGSGGQNPPEGDTRAMKDRGTENV